MKLASLAVMIGLPLAAVFTGGARLVPFLAMPLVVLGGPMLFELRARRGPENDAEDDSDSDDGPGGNRRPDLGPTAPSGPRGELPLEFSAPAGWRMRGNGPQRTADPGRRGQPRPVPSPGRRRTPARHI